MKISDIILKEDYNDLGTKALPLLFLEFLCLNILKKVSIQIDIRKMQIGRNRWEIREWKIKQKKRNGR